MIYKIKEFIIRRLRFPRSGIIYRIGRALYKKMVVASDKKLEKKMSAARSILRHNDNIVSITIDRNSGSIYQFPHGKFRYSDYDNPEDLLGSIIRSGSHNYDEDSELFSKLIKSGDTVMDIGANFGWYTMDFARLNAPNGLVFAFEPTPEAYRNLTENVRLNGLDSPPRVISINSAVGGEKGKTKIYIPRKLGSAFATLNPSTIKKDFVDLEATEVYKTTLDEFLATSANAPKHIDFIKCDVEGAELEVIKGARKTLSGEHPPLLYVEVNENKNRSDGIFATMKNLGYDAYYLENNRLKPFEQKTDIIFRDILFAKDDAKIKHLISR
ncbi:MAG: FkbM family methyltransferase [Patescibacteria group bacterium]|nr:FkbM family methyltransferase [Patescibacteria group bacterium]MDE2015242.1 FkbM family methyltransferase [Patescibacteria group bacterium]MDE2227048.1 FkbM family methyltransferase [Patescibacteria group bacterium]